MKYDARQPASSPRPDRRLGLETLEDRRLLAIAPQLIADINQVQVAASSGPSSVVEFQGLVYFTAGALWKSDGTAAGTVRVTDQSGGVGELTVVGDVLFFVGYDAAGGRELWRTDGTASGTTLVKDIRPGPATSYPFALTNVAGTLYFGANDGVTGLELWKSDGTNGGTVIVKDSNPGPASGLRLGGTPNITSAGGIAYFIGNDGATGYNVWRTDGSEAGTFLLRDSYHDSLFVLSEPSNLVSVGDSIYFVAPVDPDGGYLEGVWKSDGTVAGTVLVSNLGVNAPVSSWPSSLVNHDGVLYFFQATRSEGDGLWKLDPLAPGPTFVADLLTDGDWPFPVDLTSHNGVLYFAANVGSQLERGSGLTLWRSDGTQGGTSIVADIRAAHHEVPFLPTQSPGIVGLGDAIYFPVNQSSTGVELWKSDGTTAGTLLVTDLYPGPLGGVFRYTPLWPAGNALFFSGSNGVSGFELWRSDGTEPGTTLVADIAQKTADSTPRYLANLGGTVLFVANDGLHGPELWKSAGVGHGAVLVKDINPGALGSFSTAANAPSFTDVDGVLYFNANDGATGNELWRTDGTTDGTYLVNDINPGLGGSGPRYLTNVSGMLFFTAAGASGGIELWMSDGSAAGTAMVRDIHPTGSSTPRKLVNVSGTLFFAAADPVFGSELWKSDGSESGTTRVKDIRAGSRGANPTELVNVNGELYFVAQDVLSTFELWRSDGAETGTTLVKTFSSTRFRVGPRYLNNVSGTLLFVANDGANGYELWKSDGTTAGTFLVKDINPAASGISAQTATSFAVMGGFLFFEANHGTESGDRLWRSDGTTEGTIPLTSLSEPGGNRPRHLMPVGGQLYFVNDATSAFNRVWRTDGSQRPEPIELDVTFLWIGMQGGPRLFNADGALYFTAEDSEHGQELWGIPALPAVDGDFNDDSRVDGHDFLAWQRQLGSTVSPAGGRADGDASGTVDAGDLAVWQNNFGATASLAAATTAAASPEADERAALDAIYAAGDFTGLFVSTERPTRGFRPGRRASAR